MWNAETARVLVRLGARRVWLPEELTMEDLASVRAQMEDPASGAACERVVSGEAPAVVVRNIGQIPTVRAAGVPWEVGSPLQVWNAETARVLVRLGARRVWLPEELTMEDLASVRAQMEDPASGPPSWFATSVRFRRFVLPVYPGR